MTDPPPASSSVARLASLAILWAAGSLVVLAWSLARLELDPMASLEAGAANLRHLWPFWLASASGWLALTLLWWCLHRAARDDTARTSASVAVVLLVALGARIAVLTSHTPTLSDDIYRYVFDGGNLANGLNPYLERPKDAQTLEETWPGQRDVASRVNNSELFTIYLPTSQWTFAGIALTTGADTADGLARHFRVAFVVVEMLLVGLLLMAVHRAGRSVWWVALYAWHPLAVTEIAGSGHQDVLGVALLALGLLLHEVRPQSIWRWTSSLALAAFVKPFCVPVAGVLLRGRPWKEWGISLGVGVLVGAVLAAPLWLPAGGEPVRNLEETSSRFSQKWTHFGSIYEPVYWTLNQINPIEDFHEDWATRERHERVARLICLALIGLVIIAVLRSRLDHWAAARVILFAMVLFSSTAHPWYLLWSLALMPRAPSPALWIASLTLPWGYVAWSYGTNPAGDLGWVVPGWVMAIAFVPVYVALVWDVLKTRTRPRPSSDA